MINENDKYQLLLNKYNELMNKSKEKIEKLNEENDLLSEANLSLLDENKKLKLQIENLNIFSKCRNISQIKEEQSITIPEDILTEGNNLIIKDELSFLHKPHEYGNLLSVALHSVQMNLVCSGGVDKYIVIHNWKTKEKKALYMLEAPVLSISFNPSPNRANYILATSMDGKHYVLEYIPETNSNNAKIQLIHKIFDHSGPGMLKALWNDEGTAFATASCDKSLNIYVEYNDNTNESVKYKKEKSFYFNSIPEALAFVKKTNQLVVAVRSDCYLHYIDFNNNYEKTRINMNIDDIEHVSYNINDLALSPSGKYLIAATDKSRHFLFEVGSNKILRNFYGHKAEGYSQPRVIWHHSEKFVFSNSEDGGFLYVWSVASEKIVHKIKAHNVNIRDICAKRNKIYDNLSIILATVSYDKSLKIWSF